MNETLDHSIDEFIGSANRTMDNIAEHYNQQFGENLADRIRFLIRNYGINCFTPDGVVSEVHYLCTRNDITFAQLVSQLNIQIGEAHIMD